MEKVKEIAMGIVHKAIKLAEDAILAMTKLTVNTARKITKKAVKAAADKMVKCASPIAKIVMIISSVIALISALIYVIGKKK